MHFVEFKKIKYSIVHTSILMGFLLGILPQINPKK